MKNTLGKLLLLSAGLCAAGAAAQEAWPSKPIRLLVPLAAGGATDQAARLMAAALSEVLGQQVVAENVTGAAGAIALQRLAGAEPDGYTLAATANSLHTVAPHTSRLPYDAVRDFSMIGSYAAFQYVLVVGAQSPIASVADLLARARQSPGLVTYGSSGVGTGNHLAGALLGQMSGTEFNAIPYRGGSPAMVDVLAGRTDFMFDVLGGAMPLIQGGKAKPLGTSGSQRAASLPQVPAIAETVPGYDAGGWFALIGPAGLPEEIVGKLNDALNRIQQDSAYRKQLAAMGYSVLPGSPDDLSQRVAAESRKWADVVGKLPCSSVPARCAPDSASK
ncbi:tripartite tricarboxylate transporter substrate binding protein [Bordetella sp. BOR01]|uniref:Bug family tripartite tricarboxylate transporter substrate binding protein n=1 Tax=Bordetella sp. BOR01 TaxID=2854779 RepID=UPI001C465B29|nr:tripartite tricarboxylate transporter substrate binding protein [Bordetella sp. BOR01]MBV7481346.1 tripartite tricarboxylate transporter substrate binding protein [Bordetella sp. BOR01]